MNKSTNNNPLILKSLIDTNHWLSVELTLQKLYSDLIEDTEPYERVYEKLKRLYPQKTDITLVICPYSDEEDEDSIVANVYGESPSEEFGLALEFMTWDKWLGFSISEETMDSYNELEIIAHCLYEMTFFGYEEEEIQEHLKRIKGIAEEYKNMSPEEKKANTISLEELKKKIEDSENEQDEE